jgi:hypothetical protein
MQKFFISNPVVHKITTVLYRLEEREVGRQHCKRHLDIYKDE